MQPLKLIGFVSVVSILGSGFITLAAIGAIEVFRFIHSGMWFGGQLL